MNIHEWCVCVCVGLATVEDGRTIVFADGISVPLTIQKSNGAFTYDTSDLAALRHRAMEENHDWLIYVVDSGQSLHFQTIFSVGRQAGYCSETTRLDHVGFGVVLGEDRKKFKTRKGDTIRLVDLLDEGLQRTWQRLTDTGRHNVSNREPPSTVYTLEQYLPIVPTLELYLPIVPTLEQYLAVVPTLEQYLPIVPALN